MALRVPNRSVPKASSGLRRRRPCSDAYFRKDAQDMAEVVKQHCNHQECKNQRNHERCILARDMHGEGAEASPPDVTIFLAVDHLIQHAEHVFSEDC
jgi:hypothetical protein